MPENRLAFFAAAGAARPILALTEVGERWEQPSALPEMSVGALAAHLVRTATTVETYLGKHVSRAEDPLSAATYIAQFSNDLGSPTNVGVRQRSAEIAQEGHRAVLEQFDRTVDTLRARLHSEPSDRLIEVRDGYVLTLEEYLATRVVELLVHTDDLCVSVGHATPALPALDVAIATLVDVAAFRHGELAVLRALARRERDYDEALRVL